MSYRFLLFVMMIFGCTGYQSVQQTKTESYKLVNADVMENVYIVTQNNSIYKYQQHQIKYSQNFKIYGNISSIDCSNPMELYVYYKEANNVVFLDNTLSYRGALDLSKTAVGLASVLCRSYDNGLWVFDQADLQVKKLNKAGEIQQTSGNPIVISAVQINPVYMVEDGTAVYMSDSTYGIIITDLNATYQRTIPIKGIKQFSVNNNQLFYMQNSQIISLDLAKYTKSILYTSPLKNPTESFTLNNGLITPDIDSVYKFIHF